MITWHIGKKIEIDENPNQMRNALEFESQYYRGDERGTEEHNIVMTKHEDGSVSLSVSTSDDGFVCLDPEQVMYLRQLLGGA